MEFVHFFHCIKCGIIPLKLLIINVRCSSLLIFIHGFENLLIYNSEVYSGVFSINLFQLNAPFLYPLEKSEKLCKISSLRICSRFRKLITFIILRYTLEFSQLTHFSPVLHFYIPSRRQKIFGVLKYSGGLRMGHWATMG